ncbi:cytochrome P450 [Kitasatospora xanthocidica]|uniref:Cytochrome P450 n=1 Tax=Kitasatospora xanthocidica TaxID=83382 RepID=A0A372ZPC5_9ACTN|nr:cytochrome P450 [Kitasatospora xanthocidica]RGD57312.1 cytochrome P450 [Kitasatospora xanthocidica]
MTLSDTDILQWPLPAGEHGTPPPLYATLRRERPVCPLRMPSGQTTWLLTRHDDITGVLTDPRFSRDLVYPGAPRLIGEDFNSVPGGIFNLDPPRHTRVRQILNPLFNRRAAERYSTAIAAHAEDLLTAMAAGSNPADLVSAYTAPLALRVSCGLLRIPADRRQALHGCFREQTSQNADRTDVSAATEQIGALAAEIVADKWSAPDPTEPIGALIAARQAEEITSDELHGTVSYLLVTGIEPLVSSASTGIVTLLRHPEELQCVLEDPRLWPAVVEEVLRFHHNGYLSNPRVALEDTEIRGVPIRAGESVVTPMIAATWDPDHYKHPHRFNIHRRTDGSRTFGAGPHFCLGASLARAYLRIAFEALFTRFPRLILAIDADELPWDEDNLFTRPLVLPVAW